MIKFASTFTDEIAKSEALKVLTPVLPCDEYSFYIQSYDLVKKSEIVGEAQFTLACRVDVKSKDDVAKFLTDIGMNIRASDEKHHCYEKRKRVLKVSYTVV